MEIDSILKEIGARNGLEIALDENRACTLELSDGRSTAGASSKASRTSRPAWRCSTPSRTGTGT